MGSNMLNTPTMTEILADAFQRDARVVSLLSQTCRTYRDAFPTTPEMHDLMDWTICQERIEDSLVESDSSLVFNNAKIVYTGQRRRWLITGECGRESVKVFEHIGVIRAGKCSATLTIIGETQWTMHKDSFYGIQDLDTLKRCMLSHTILCHELPENLPRLPAAVVHRHRDNVPWTFARAFYVWRATRKGYETWNGGRSADPDDVDMAHRVIYFG